MADRLKREVDVHGQAFDVLYHENADGSYSQAVNAGALPLPAGAATEATQLLNKADLDSTVTKLNGGLPAALGAGGGLRVDGSGIAFPTSSTLQAGEAHAGEIGTPADLADVTLVLDTNPTVSGDVMSITALLPNVSRVNDGRAYPFSIQVIDEDKQSKAFDILFFRSNVSIGTLNNPYSIDDAGSRDLIGKVSIATTDFEDWGNWSMAFIKDTDAAWKMGLWEPAAGTRNVYIATVDRAGQIHTASGIRLKISVGQN